MQEIDVALHLALERAGNNMAAKMAMMAITTSNSIKVKPDLPGGCRSPFEPRVFAFMKLFLILASTNHCVLSIRFFSPMSRRQAKFNPGRPGCRTATGQSERAERGHSCPQQLPNV